MKSMSSSDLKLFACATMLADHVGTIFFPEQLAWRVVGRLTLPIFAFLITEGYRHTKDVRRYLVRLFFIGLISQPVYQFAFTGGKFAILNIFATLFLGLLALTIYDRLANKLHGISVILLIALLAELLRADYGAYGVLLIFSFHAFDIRTHVRQLVISQTALAALFVAGNIWLSWTSSHIIPWSFLTQLAAPLALPLIYAYRGDRGRKLRVFFYAFYPVHVFILGTIKIIFDIARTSP